MSNGNVSGDSRITVRDISSSTGVAIGPGARASVSASGLNTRDEITAQLTRFTQQLAFYQDDVENAGDIQQIAADALAESTRPEPKWQAVRRMLTAVGASVAGIAALTDAVDHIQQLVSRMLG
jgi:predicted XRE-type DNA-binding protein